jgi:membrane protease YdiL (CAAX protease family)
LSEKDQSAVQAVVGPVAVGVLVLLAGTIPRNLLFFANLRYVSGVPWSVPLVVGYIWVFWKYVGGAGPPRSTAIARAARLRARQLPPSQWLWSLLAGALGVASLVIALQLVNRMVRLPPQEIPDLSQIPAFTVAALLVMSAPVAGIVEESAFRGYMQGPIERQYGLPIAILITGTMFAVVHLDFTPILWPYYVAVAGLYGTVTYMTGSILPAIVLHTCANLYSSFDLWLHGQAEWQAPSSADTLIWVSGVDMSFLVKSGALLAAAAGMMLAFRNLARAPRSRRGPDSR